MITFDESKRYFHLKNQYLSMILSLRRDDMGCEELLMPYFGAPMDDPESALFLAKEHERASFDSERQLLKYACPTEGRGDYRPSMIAARDASGQTLTELFYQGYEIENGKRPLQGLPATYVEADSEAQTLRISLCDPVTGLTAEISYTLFRSFPAIASSVRLINGGKDALTIENASSLCLALDGRWDMLHLNGGWAKERQVERVAPARMTRQIESCRGASGHEHNPFCAMLSPDATEFTGECYGVSLVYSGDFRIAADENAFGSTRVVAGLNPRTLSWRLSAGEQLQTPEAVLVYSQSGLNGMSQCFHALYRTRLCRGSWRDRERPILINNWEATYFSFDHDKLMTIAKAAAKLGVELFVLDDGWFGRRSDDHSSLGDWVVNRQKLPKGLDGLANEMAALGLRFGLWFEPEMISPDSDLYRAHPDWCLHVPKRPRTQARWQLTLDMSRQDVQDYVVSAVSGVLRSAPIGYVKWDMNRNFLEAGSALLDDRQGELHHRYMLGLYAVLERVTSAFPDVLFESCSGGGGRFDAGMLYYMPQTWTSDDTDAMERLHIQYGTSMVYPASAMSAHVSAVPNHQVGRVTSMKTRGDVALSGNFGYELDLSRQTDEDLAEIARQIKLVKRIRGVIQQGVMTRLISPFDGDVTAWQFVSDKMAVLCAFVSTAHANAPELRVRMRELPSGAVYQDENGTLISAEALMGAGTRPGLNHDFTSSVMVFERVK